MIEGDLYIYGGLVSADTLAGDEMHIVKLSNANRSTLGPQYQVLPAIARDGDDVPSARAGHSACVIDSKVVIYGGYGNVNDPKPLQEGGRVWIFDPQTMHWSHLDAANEKFPSRYLHAAAAHGNRLILHGGFSESSESEPETDVWVFDLETRVWTELPALNDHADGQSRMISTSPPNLAVVDDSLYIVAGSSDAGSLVYSLNLSADAEKLWTTMHFSTNPLTTGPRPRKGAGLVPITTGMGRSYLVFMLGEKEEPPSAGTDKQGEQSETEYWSGIWVLQLPSSSRTLAQAKDVIRDKTGMDSHEAEWAEVELEVNSNVDTKRTGGKSHPGPRAYFASAQLTAKQVIMWGGLNPKGEREGDGWVLDLKVA